MSLQGSSFPTTPPPLSFLKQNKVNKAVNHSSTSLEGGDVSRLYYNERERRHFKHRETLQVPDGTNDVTIRLFSAWMVLATSLPSPA